MHWEIPQKVGALDRWIRSLDDDALDAFIRDIRYLVGDEGGKAVGHGHLVIATILGAACRWRDERVRPIETLRETAPPGFYQGVAA